MSRGPNAGTRCYMHLSASEKVFFATIWARQSIHRFAAASNVGGSPHFTMLLTSSFEFTPVLAFSFPGNRLRRSPGGFVNHPASKAKAIRVDAVLPRYEPKQFKQRRPDGKGGWLWNLDGVRRVLYRLADVLAARFVLVCVTPRRCGPSL